MWTLGNIATVSQHATNVDDVMTCCNVLNTTNYYLLDQKLQTLNEPCDYLDNLIMGQSKIFRQQPNQPSGARKTVNKKQFIFSLHYLSYWNLFVMTVITWFS